MPTRKRNGGKRRKTRRRRRVRRTRRGGGLWSWLRGPKFPTDVDYSVDPTGHNVFGGQLDLPAVARPARPQGSPCSKSGAMDAFATAIDSIGRASSAIDHYRENTPTLPVAGFLDDARVDLAEAMNAVRSQQRCIAAAGGGRRRKPKTRRRKRTTHQRGGAATEAGCKTKAEEDPEAHWTWLPGTTADTVDPRVHTNCGFGETGACCQTERCSVCFEQLADGTVRPAKGKHQHGFCKSCVAMLPNNQCPLCREHDVFEPEDAAAAAPDVGEDFGDINDADELEGMLLDAESWAGRIAEHLARMAPESPGRQAMVAAGRAMDINIRRLEARIAVLDAEGE